MRVFISELVGAELVGAEWLAKVKKMMLGLVDSFCNTIAEFRSFFLN